MADLDSSVSPRAPRAKSIFASKTFWGAIFTAVAAVAPIIGGAVDNRQLSGKDAAQVVVVLAGTAATVLGRVQAEAQVYTPHNLPGLNREDLDPSQFPIDKI